MVDLDTKQVDPTYFSPWKERPDPQAIALYGQTIEPNTQKEDLHWTMRELDTELSALVRQQIAAQGIVPSVFWTAITSAWMARVSEQTTLQLLTCEHDWRLQNKKIDSFATYLPLVIDTAGNPRLDEIVERVAADRELMVQCAPESLPNSAGFGPVRCSYSRITTFDQTESSAKAFADTEPAIASVAIDVLESGPNWPLQIRFGFDAHIFEPQQQETAVRHYLRMLEGLLADHARLHSIPLVTPEECHGLAGPGPEQEVDHLLDQLQVWVQSTPAAPAVRQEDTIISFAELDFRARRYAAALRASGVGSGDRIAVCLYRTTELVAAMVGTFYAGATYVPIDASNPGARKRKIIADAEPSLIILDAQTKLEFPEDMTVVSLEDELPPPMEGTGARDKSSYMIYTSGSTGAPKGVCVGHSSLANQLQAMRSRIAFRPSDHLLAVTTTAFDASVFELCFPLWCGACVEIISDAQRRDPKYIAARLDEGNVSAMFATPATWHMLIASGWSGQNPSFQVICGGEALSRQLADDLLERAHKVWNIYGPTETTICSTVADVKSDHAVVPLGDPIAHTTLRILNEQMQLVPQGVVGELYIGGAGVGEGYYRQPELTAERFLNDPFDPEQRLYKTGDIVRLEAGNKLIYLGRSDNQVKLRGYRIEIGEVEAALQSLPEVKRAVVVMQGEVLQERFLHGFVEVSSELDHGEALHRLNDLIPGYMVPKLLTTVTELPITTNGKIDRQRLISDASTAIPATTSGGDLPQSDLEVKVAQVWRETLQLDSARDSNFFDNGGNSLLAVNLLSALEERIGGHISFREFYEDPTIRGLASYIDRTTGNIGPDTPVLLNDCPNKTATPLYCIDGVHLYQSLAKSLQSDLPVYGVYSNDEQQMLANVIAGNGVDNFPSPADLASRYYKILRKFQPQGPYRLAGFSYGGMVAYELARMLRGSGAEVDALILLDTPLMRSIERSRGWLHLTKHNTRIRLQERGFNVINKDPLNICRILAADNYENEVSSCEEPALLCRALGESRTRREIEPSLGWIAHIAKLTVVDCPGDHFGMLAEHHEDVAAAIRTYISNQSRPDRPVFATSSEPSNGARASLSDVSIKFRSE